MSDQAKIYIVEDEPLVGQTLERHLVRLGYRVLGQSDNALDALSQIPLDPPDLVLMDIRIEGEIDGVEAAERIRELFGIPVVYLTALMDDQTLERAKITQPFGYIIKPFSRRELHIGLEIAMYKAQVEHQISRKEDMLTGIVQASPGPMCLCGTDFRIQCSNESMNEFLGIEEDAEGALLPDSWRRELQRHSIKREESGESLPLEHRLSDGSHAQSVAVRDRLGRLIGYSLSLSASKK